MKLWTSSWFVALPPGVVRVGVSRGTPRGQGAAQRLPALAPCNHAWAHRGDAHAFARAYRAQLRGLDPVAIVAQLEEIGGGQDVALLCWEPPTAESAWCHRALVAEWLADTLGLQVDEHGHAGCLHPKLPPSHPAWTAGMAAEIAAPDQGELDL